EEKAPWPVEQRAYAWEIGEFTPADYQCVCQEVWTDSKPLDYARIHQFCPSLNGHQLRNASHWLAQRDDVDTSTFIEYLREHDMSSNVEIEEVPRVDWKDLKGVDDVI